MTWTPHVSASQIETFSLCERKWAFRLKDKTQNIGAFRGDAGHRILEAYGRDRTPPETHEANLARALQNKFPEDLIEKKITAEDYAARIIACCNKMIPHLPEPPWDRVEESIAFELDGVHFIGRVDLQHSGNVVHDHKFSAGADWAKTPEELLTDAQALIYAYWKLLTDSPSEVKLNWLYGIPGAKPRAFMREQTITPAHVREAIRPHLETGKKIVKLRVLDPDPLTLEPNWTACNEMGGCAYGDRCVPTAEQMIAGYFKDDTKKPTEEKRTMGLIAKKKAEKAAEGTIDVAKGVAEVKQQRSDDAGVKAECAAQAKTLLGLGVSSADAIATLQKRFVGLPSAQITEIVNSAGPTTGQPINPPDSPKEPEGVVQEEKKGKKGKARVGDVGGDSYEQRCKAALLARIDKLTPEATAHELGLLASALAQLLHA